MLRKFFTINPDAFYLGITGIVSSGYRSDGTKRPGKADRNQHNTVWWGDVLEATRFSLWLTFIIELLLTGGLG